jgi:SAM-dependent methyltransferase
MTEPAHLRSTRTSYDTVAADYATLVPPAFDRDIFGRAMLAAFAELVRDAGNGPVADVGCGPGHVTAHLHSLGLTAFGVDLSPGMVEVARRNHPGLRFDVGSMTALEQPDGKLGGVLAWWSLVHTPPEVLPVVFDEFHRVLAPGGHVLLGFHAGDERRHKKKGYGGHPMSVDVYLMPPDRVAGVAARAGLEARARLFLDREGLGNTAGACLLLRKPVTS